MLAWQPGLWDREFLLSVLSDEHNENPWMSELMGSQRAMLVSVDSARLSLAQFHKNSLFELGW
jgi:hypothetical protein